MILSAMNQKGGVGKTSLCYHMAGTLTREGKKVLLVDNDPQASLTQGFLGPQATEAIPASATIAAIYDGSDPFPADLILSPATVPGVDLIPGGAAVMSHNVPDPFVLPQDRQAYLGRWLAEAAGGYDVVLIDSPPNLHLCSWASLLAADALVVPVQPEDFGAQGLGPIRAFGAAARHRGNPQLRMLGYLVTMFDGRTSNHTSYLKDLRDSYGELIFEETIPRLTGFSEAIGHRLPASHHKPKDRAAAVMVKVAGEIQRRYTQTPPGGGQL